MKVNQMQNSMSYLYVITSAMVEWACLLLVEHNQYNYSDHICECVSICACAFLYTHLHGQGFMFNSMHNPFFLNKILLNQRVINLPFSTLIQLDDDCASRTGLISEVRNMTLYTTTRVIYISKYL